MLYKDWHTSVSYLPEEFLSAIEELNMRNGSSSVVRNRQANAYVHLSILLCALMKYVYIYTIHKGSTVWKAIACTRLMESLSASNMAKVLRHTEFLP